MSAQPVHDHTPPRIKRTIKGIRAALPAKHHARFDADWAEVDLGDLTAVARLRDAWWASAWIETDAQLSADLDDAAAGLLEFFPSPFAR